MKETEFTSYGDDTTLHDAGNSIEDTDSFLQEPCKKTLEKVIWS